jgi:hypothetical protein
VSDTAVVGDQSPDVRLRDTRYFGALFSFAAMGSSWSVTFGQYDPRMS